MLAEVVGEVTVDNLAVQEAEASRRLNLGLGRRHGTSISGPVRHSEAT